MSPIRAYANTKWVDADLYGDAPLRYWTGTQWSDLDVTITPPTGTPDPTPVAAFTALPNMTMFMDAADPLNTGSAPTDKAPTGTWTAKTGGVAFTSPIVAGETTAQTNARAPKFYAATSTEPAHLRFNGSHRMFTDTSLVPNTGAFSVYVVARSHHLGYGTIFSAGNQTPATSNPAFSLDHDSYGRTRSLRRTDDGAIALTYQNMLANSWRVFAVTSSDYKALSFRVNEKLSAATASATSTTGTATMNRMSIGARVSPNGTDAYGSLWAGDIAAVVVYSEAHDATTRQAVEQQLATRYKFVLPSQGGTIDGPVSRITDHRQQLSVEYGIPATHRVTGKTLPGFHNVGPNPAIQSTDYQIVEGTLTTTGDNQVVTKKWITGNVIIKHAGVVFQDCILASTIDPKFDTRSAPTTTDLSFVTVDRCEIFGKEEDQGTGIGYIRYNLINSFLHDCEDNSRLNKNTVIRNNLMGIHSNGYIPGKDERLHTDCVQANGGDNATGEMSYVQDNTLIAFRHNNTKGNSAIILATEGASVNGVNQGSPLRHVLVEGNYMAGGSYSLYIKTAGTSGSPGPMEDITIRNNVFRGTEPANAPLPSGSYALYGDAWLPYASLADTFLTFTGNVREDGSAIVVDRSTA
jgi:hypothetical protein